MSARALLPVPQTYAHLRDAVIAVVVQGRQEIDRAWVETYHETGRLINEHVLQFRDRAGYGARVYEKLAEDTGVSVRTLRECVQFHRCFPIRRARAELSWAHYRLLVQIEDEGRRKTLETEAVRKHWTSRDLETHVRSINAVALAVAANGHGSAPTIELLTPRLGTPGLHPIVDRGSGPEVDLGFKFYRALGPTSKLTTKDIVRLNEDGIRKMEYATPDQLFTYAATVRRIIDGDTPVVALAVAPGFTHELKLRLRGIDCPEMSIAAGRAAKAFVEGLVHPGDEVLLSTTKPDKYDRYLADVFVGGCGAQSLESRDRNSGSQLSALGSQLTPASQHRVSGTSGSGDRNSSLVTHHSSHDLLFLNNALLEAGHAVPYDGGAKEE